MKRSASLAGARAPLVTACEICLTALVGAAAVVVAARRLIDELRSTVRCKAHAKYMDVQLRSPKGFFFWY